MIEFIKIRGAKENNLKNIDVDIPKNQLVVITGLSGSGKSSLAFDTIYAEGQRRYVESLSTYARQFLQLQNKPDVESISGLSPAIAIDQKTTYKNPRSTVGTITEIYDYLRLLYARIGIPYSPSTNLPIKSQTVQQMVDSVLKIKSGERVILLAPIVRGAKGEYKKELLSIKKQGFQRVKINGEVYDLDELPQIDKNKKNNIDVVVDRLEIADDIAQRLTESIEIALKLSNGILYVEKLASEYSDSSLQIYSEKFACPISGFQIDEIEPRIFSFNSPYGACQYCEGLGRELFFDKDLVIPDKKKSLNEGAIYPWKVMPSKGRYQILSALAKFYKFSLDTPYGELSKEVQDVILFGSGEQEIEIQLDMDFSKKVIVKPFEGVIPLLERQMSNSESGWVKEELNKFQSDRSCQNCHGYRLKPESLCIKIDNKNIGEVCDFTISNAYKWFQQLPDKLDATQKIIGEKVIEEIVNRLSFLSNVGIDYLTLSRESGTLSGGECQRIRLASQIGSGLTGVLYVLDEPSIGLHQRDNRRLIETLKKLQSLGNTVIVVEHDNETILSADYVVDIGPGAGENGGLVVAKGTPEEIKLIEESFTGMYLSGARSIEIPKVLRTINPEKQIEIIGARANNLKNVTVKIPLSVLTCVTGVSGGGKSSLIIHTLYKAAIKSIENTKVVAGEHDLIKGIEYVDKVIEIDQSPIGRTPRSNPATYTGAFNYIRDWYAGLHESKVRGYKVGRFSFNVKGGRCEACQGDGVLKIEMHFLQDVYVKCEECKGDRYNKPTLEVKYNGKSIADVLNMTVEVAVKFFDNIPQIRDKLKALEEVGLGYIKLGQSATTLSGGEAQRVKLAKELARKSTGRTLYILDEPTTGLHSEDIRRLLIILHKLADYGNTVIIIEHNLDVIKTADYVIDIGPDGGDGGGQIIAQGRPQDVANTESSITGKFLKPIFDNAKI